MGCGFLLFQCTNRLIFIEIFVWKEKGHKFRGIQRTSGDRFMVFTKIRESRVVAPFWSVFRETLSHFPFWSDIRPNRPGTYGKFQSIVPTNTQSKDNPCSLVRKSLSWSGPRSFSLPKLPLIIICSSSLALVASRWIRWPKVWWPFK